ncbi:MAG: D-tyrosyl-tRNA(Tyr) deacylase [Campylobacterales bacterium]|nr:D-tyrosyl-tRNA(Tyr) deacylase [Campylobacterales bacterium]
MIALLQRVRHSAVRVEGKIVGEIGVGLNVLLGIFKDDDEKDIALLVPKILHMRIFEDNEGKMNRSLLDMNGELLVISQFTLAANIKKGRRPSFDGAMPPERAKTLYEEFILTCKAHAHVQSGVFGATMDVEIHNDGPVSIIVDSKAL